MSYEVKLLVPPTEITAESIQAWIADAVYPIRGKEPANNSKLFDRLLKESFGNTASRVFQYVPCVVRSGTSQHKKLRVEDTWKMYGFISGEESAYYTNARELLNWGWSLEQILPTIDFTNYRAVRVKAPRFIYNQLQTHDNVTSVSFSARYSDNKLGYWMPAEYRKYIFIEYGMSDEHLYQQSWNAFVDNTSPKELKLFMKDELGINRKEIYNRGADSLEYVEFTLGSFTNHGHYWKHFLQQRYTDQHTQLETRNAANMIADVIGMEIK